MEYLKLLSDVRLLLLFSVSALISLLSATTIATRIAAVNTRKVALAFSIFSIFFLITRFANLFYLPYLGIYVDKAEQTGNTDILLMQIRIIVFGAAIGAILGWILLPTFVEIYRRGIEALDKYKSMVKVLLILVFNPKSWIKIIKCFRTPSFMGAKLFNFEGVSPGFLYFNVFATGIWTVGALCAIFASAIHPEMKRTAVLLSGLVNAVAAIFFSLIIDPKASLITDLIVKGERPEKQIHSISLHLMLGNVVGCLLAQFFIVPGAIAIDTVAMSMGSYAIAGNFVLLAVFNAIVMLKASTTYSSRISAVITKNVATAIAIYNFFFLLTRIAQQIFAPMIGTMVDNAVKTSNLQSLELQFRWLIGGSTIGALLGFLLLPTFVEVYNKAINGMQKFGSLTNLIWKSIITPSIWAKAIMCLKPPSFMNVKLKDINKIPKNFIYANIIVIAFHTIGVISATFASASYPDARGVTLLSSVINGVATILLSILVDPATALVTEETISERRPFEHIKITAVFLSLGTVIGTILSQFIFVPCTEFIKFCSSILGSI